MNNVMSMEYISMLWVYGNAQRGIDFYNKCIKNGYKRIIVYDLFGIHVEHLNYESKKSPIFLDCCDGIIALGGPRTTTYYNRNGSIQFRATENCRDQIQTSDSRGVHSGSFQRSGNTVRQVSPGFNSAKSNSSFSSRGK